MHLTFLPLSVGTAVSNLKPMLFANSTEIYRVLCDLVDRKVEQMLFGFSASGVDIGIGFGRPCVSVITIQEVHGRVRCLATLEKKGTKKHDCLCHRRTGRLGEAGR